MKKTITTFALATILAFGTTFANGGIIVAGRADDSKTCNTQTEGIIVAGFAGIIVAGFSLSGTPVDTAPCTQPDTQREGIIVAGRDGIIVAG